MQVRRCRGEGSEAPGFVCRWWAIEKPSTQMTLPQFTPCRALKAGRNQHAQIRSQESAVRNQGGYVHSPTPWPWRRGVSSSNASRTLRVHEEYDSQPKWRVMAKAPHILRTLDAETIATQARCQHGRLQKAIPRSAPIRPLPVIRGGLWLLPWRDRHALSIANPW